MTHTIHYINVQSLTYYCVIMEGLVASLTVRIAKYSENLKQLVEDVEAVRVKGKLVRDIDDIERRICKLSVDIS